MPNEIRELLRRRELHWPALPAEPVPAGAFFGLLQEIRSPYPVQSERRDFSRLTAKQLEHQRVLRDEQGARSQVIVVVALVHDGRQGDRRQRSARRRFCGVPLLRGDRRTFRRDGEAQSPQAGQGEHRALDGIRHGDTARLAIDGGRDIAVVKCGRAPLALSALATELDGLALRIEPCLARVQGPLLRRVLVRVDHAALLLDASRVDPARRRLHPGHHVEANDL